MQRKKWMFWLHNADEDLNASASSLIENGACHEWTPFLTALFDGEADEQSALQARRHMIVCERCARAWYDWNQTRNLLQNHSAPAPPPSLLWRIRLACRLGQPASQRTPELASQILARTTRATPHPSFFEGALQGLRVHMPLAGALALGAFVLLLSRDGLLSFSNSPTPSARLSARVSRQSLTHLQGSPRLSRGGKTTPLVISPRSHRTFLAPLSHVEPISARSESRERSLETLARARRERETLGEQPVRFASYETNEPLPMLEAPRPRPTVVQNQPIRRRALPPARLAALDDVTPRPVASAPLPFAPRTATAPDTPPIVLASFTPSSEATSSRVPRATRLVSASTPSGTTLRISTPHALPITVSQPASSDDSGLAELNSTVQEYRDTFSEDEYDASSDAE